jgi:hypothetical protein
MLSLGEIAQIKAEIERLERLRKECTIPAFGTGLGRGSRGRKRSSRPTHRRKVLLEKEVIAVCSPSEVATADADSGTPNGTRSH